MRALFAFLSLTLVLAAVALHGVAADGDGDCHDEIMNLTVKRGETVYPEGKCLRVSCSEDGHMHPEPCEMAIPPNCVVVDGDMSKEWPGCCPTLKCESEEEDDK